MTSAKRGKVVPSATKNASAASAVACSKRLDSGERRELGKASEKKNASFSLHCFPRRCPILLAFPHYLNAWNRLQARETIHEVDRNMPVPSIG